MNYVSSRQVGLCAVLCVNTPNYTLGPSLGKPAYAKASAGKGGKAEAILRSLQLPDIWLSDDNIAEGLLEHLALVCFLYSYAEAVLPFLL